MTVEISHNEIYDRLCNVETKVDQVVTDTADMIAAFRAAQGAFTVLEWLAKLAKPILWIGAVATAIVSLWPHSKL
jgi:hypothetical protein